MSRRRLPAIQLATPPLLLLLLPLLLLAAGCGPAVRDGVAATAPTGAVQDTGAADGGAAGERLGAILASHPGLADVVAAAPHYRLQVVLGEVEEQSDGRRRLVQHTFRAGEEYLYPASTVKLFAAVAALEKLAELRRETSLPIDADTPLVYHPLFAGETLENADPTNLAGGKLTVRHEIRK